VSPFECKVLGAVVERQIFSAVQEHCPLEKPVANRHSLPFLAQQEPRHPVLSTD